MDVTQIKTAGERDTSGLTHAIGGRMSTANDTTKQHHMRLRYTFVSADYRRQLIATHQNGVITGLITAGDLFQLNETELLEIRDGIAATRYQQYQYKHLVDLDNNLYVEMLRGGAKIESCDLPELDTRYRVNDGEWEYPEDEYEGISALEHHPYVTTETVQRTGQYDDHIQLFTYDPPQPCPTCGETQWESINKSHTVIFVQRCTQCGHVIEGGAK